MQDLMVFALSLMTLGGLLIGWEWWASVRDERDAPQRIQMPR